MSIIFEYYFFAWFVVGGVDVCVCFLGGGCCVQGEMCVFEEGRVK